MVFAAEFDQSYTTLACSADVSVAKNALAAQTTWA